jgi:hypothetical protein
MVRLPLPIAEAWAEMPAQVEDLTGQAGLQILRAIAETGSIRMPARVMVPVAIAPFSSGPPRKSA